MATAVGLNMKITADTSGIGRGMTRTEKLLAGVDKNAQSAARSLRAIATIQVGGAVIKGLSSIVGTLTSAANAAVGYANSLRTTIDQTAKLAARTGISVEALQGFQVAADLSGVQNLEGAIQRLTISIGDAASGVKAPQEAFARLGLDFQRLAQLRPEDQFRAVAAAIRNVGSQAEKAAVAADLFGRTGVELLPLFDSNLADIEARAKRLGIVLGRDQTAAIEQMNDSLLLVQRTFDGIIGQVTANLAPVVTALAEEFLQFVEAFEGLDGAQGGNAIADFVTSSISSGLDSFLNLIRSLGQGLLTFLDVLGRVSARIAELFGFDLRGEREKALDAEIKRASENLRLLGRAGAAAEARGEDVTANRQAFDAQQEILDRLLAERRDLSGEGLIETLRSGLDSAIDAALKANASVAERAAKAATGAAQAAASGAPNPDAFPAGYFPKEPVSQVAGLPTDEDIKRTQKAIEEATKAQEAEEKKRIALIEQTNKRILSIEKERADLATEIEAGRLESLSRASTQALSVSDIRSGGISEILRIAAGREDPAIEEYRKQLGELRKIDAKLGELQAERVEIVGNGARA